MFLETREAEWRIRSMHSSFTVALLYVTPPSSTSHVPVCRKRVCFALFWSPGLVCLGCAGWAASMPSAELMACQVLPMGRLCLPLCSATVNAEPTDCCRGNTTSSILPFLCQIHTEAARTHTHTHAQTLPISVSAPISIYLPLPSFFF